MSTPATSDAMTVVESSPLRWVFVLDRALTLALSMVLIAGCVFIGGVLEWPVWVVAAIGAGLLPVVALLHVVNRSGDFASRAAKLSVGVDTAWVIASVFVLSGWQVQTSALGKWLIATVALSVAGIGIAKVIGKAR